MPNESLINDADAFIQGLESRSKMFNHTAMEEDLEQEVMGLHIAGTAGHGM